MQIPDKEKKSPIMKENRATVTLILTSCHVQMYPNNYVFAITLCPAPFKKPRRSAGDKTWRQTE